MPASARPRLIILSVPDSLLKGANNEKLVRHVRTLNPTAKIVATADLLSDVADLYAAGADYVTVTRISDAHELFTVIEAADAGLLEDKRAEIDAQLAERRKCCRKRFRASASRRPSACRRSAAIRHSCQRRSALRNDAGAGVHESG